MAYLDKTGLSYFWEKIKAACYQPAKVVSKRFTKTIGANTLLTVTDNDISDVIPSGYNAVFCNITSTGSSTVFNTMCDLQSDGKTIYTQFRNIGTSQTNITYKMIIFCLKDQ